MATTTSAPLQWSCRIGCSIYHEPGRSCQCYYGCEKYLDCCEDYLQYCDGMAAIEQKEKLALAEVAAFSVFYSIIMFVLLSVVLLWACYTLFVFYKKHGGSLSFEAAGFVLKDTRLMIILSYIGMALYVLSIFCYLVANATLGIHYNVKSDTYGNSQIAGIIFMFLGHTIFYELYMLKLHHFIASTTYHLNRAVQYTAYGVLLLLWFISIVVMCVWIDEFHRNYHVGSANDERLIACMVIAFASHVWFCLCVVIFFSIVLRSVAKSRDTALIDDKAMSGGGSKQSETQKKEQIIEYMARISVLAITSLAINIFCMLMWLILVGLDEASNGFLRFCWWLFPINVLVAFLALFLGLNYDPMMNEIYQKVCIVPHAICKAFCIRPTIAGAQGNRGIPVYDDDDDDDEDEEDERRRRGNAGDFPSSENRNDAQNKDRRNQQDDEEDEDEEDESDEDNMLRTDANTHLKSGE
eukprot:CAMPEP_0197026406 /NCGR_PEP_ID=MMETSP1384-20130603/6494_1 /TAXON_ID=29189 /ORGANISM="Ammonia sp." /LENGTH=466 /DNA_ID=CAMNT_0042455061 /DNA_START=30 /DNA_END=1430 /DNA_ORIENTATION=+